MEKMCTNEEVEKMIKDSEICNKEVFDLSHRAISDSISDLFGDIKRQIKEMNINATTLHEMFNFFKDQHLIITAIAEKTRDADKQRISNLESWQLIKTERDENMKTDLNDIKTTLSRLMWIVVSGVIVALLGLVLR